MRSPRRDENGLKRGSWTPEEDKKLIEYIKRYRIWNWALMAKFAGLSRSGKSCRLRWVNYLNPQLKLGNITKDEEDIIVSMFSELGRRWSAIAARLPGRTDNQIKNYWHTHLKKRFDEKKVPRMETEGLGMNKFETNEPNSNDAQVTALASVGEPSNSQGLDNLSMTKIPDPYICVGESFWSSPSSTAGGNNIHDQVDIDASLKSSKLNRDLQSFWTQPFSYENLSPMNEQAAYSEEWYQLEPISPYGFYNNDYI